MPAKWRIISQREFEDLRASGQFESIIEVTFELPARGVQGTVRIPKREFTVDRVRDEVNEQAETMSAVQELEG